MLHCMPVTWNSGKRAEDDVILVPAPPHCAMMITVLITVAWVWMQPFGRPVVPEVYGITHKSSRAGEMGAGRERFRQGIAHSVTPGLVQGLAWRLHRVGQRQIGRRE